MAVAELPRGLYLDAIQQGEDLDLRVEVHDRDRLEWSVSVPLPEKKDVKYGIDLELDIPANVFAQHSPWDQMQSWTRLDGPAAAIRTSDAVDIDWLRRGAVAFAHKLARASDGFARHCRLAGALFVVAPAARSNAEAREPREELAEGLNLWLGVALATAEEARATLVRAQASDGAELRKERELVDEYISVRLLEMLAGAERALATLLVSRHASSYAEAIAEGEAWLASALEQEIAHRQTCGYVCAEPANDTLERYLDRASQLKKHFQEVLFLEAETYQVVERIQHWVAAFVALFASTWAFVWQLVLITRAPTTGSKVTSGVVLIAVIAGVVYATKDRIKEVGRKWIHGHVQRFYAQRVARWRAPARRLPSRDVIVSARESFERSVRTRPDPLNPECGAKIASTLVRFTHRGEVGAHAKLRERGLRRVKHIFRYDLSPLFARLDDAVKQVPLLDAGTHRVRFVDAPRVYRVPLILRVTCNGESREERATIVLHKRGLERLELESERAPAPSGVLLDE